MSIPAKAGDILHETERGAPESPVHGVAPVSSWRGGPPNDLLFGRGFLLYVLQDEGPTLCPHVAVALPPMMQVS